MLEQYGRGIIPLVVPVTLVNHYGRKYGDSQLCRQVFLHPHPLELRLRNYA